MRETSKPEDNFRHQNFNVEKGFEKRKNISTLFEKVSRFLRSTSIRRRIDVDISPFFYSASTERRKNRWKIDVEILMSIRRRNFDSARWEGIFQVCFLTIDLNYTNWMSSLWKILVPRFSHYRKKNGILRASQRYRSFKIIISIFNIVFWSNHIFKWETI